MVPRYDVHVWLLLGFMSAFGAGCSEAPAGGNDGGEGDDGNGATEALSWPAEELAAFEGGRAPDVSVTAGGVVLLALEREGRSEVIVDPGGQAVVVDLGEGEGGRITASPNDEEAVVLFQRYDATLGGDVTFCAWLNDGELQAPPFELIDDQEEWGLSRTERGISLYWTGAGPAAFLHSHLREISGAVEQDSRADFILLPVPRPEAGPVGLPSLGMRLATHPSYHRISHGESPTIFDLTDHPLSTPEKPMVLAAKSRAENLSEGEDFEPALQWILAMTMPGNDSHWGNWFGPVDDGTSPMPFESNTSWIEIHRLEPRKGVVTWHAPSGGMVFDVFMTSLLIDDDGVPELGEDYINVSQTYGMTDHSEHPVVRGTGDGRAWVTWRESTFGPRVSLYDEDLNRLGAAAPDVDLRQSGSAPMGAALLPGGDLVVAAQVSPKDSSPEVRVWRIELPRP